MSVLLPIQPGNLLPGVCYDSEQERLVDFAANMQAILSGQAFYNYGSTKPAAELNAYPWFRTTDGRWYFYSGGWITPNPEQSLLVRRIWVGDLTQLQSYDGGDTGSPSDRSGPMWEVDSAFAGRAPVGVGSLDPSGTAVAVLGTGGKDQVTLTDAMMPTTAIVPLDSNNNPISDRTVQKSGDSFGLPFQNGDFSGSGSGGRMTDVNLRINGGGGAAPTMPPYIGTYFIKRTARVYYLIP